MTRFLVLAFILGTIVVGYQLVVSRQRGAGLYDLDYEVPVEIRKTKPSGPAAPLTARGALEPVSEIKAVAPLSGVIKELRHRVGDRVMAGAVVATVEDSELKSRLRLQEAAVKEAEARVESSGAKAAEAEQRLAHLQALYAKSLIARREVEEAEAQAERARAEKEAAGAQLEQRLSLSAQLRHVLSLGRITAPIAGVITRQWAEAGAPVAERAPILSIAPINPVRIIVHLDSAQAESIRLGTAVRVKVDAASRGEYRGVVRHITEVANFAGDQLSCEVEVANAGGELRFGMPATLQFPPPRDVEGILVPRTALIENHGQPALYVSEGGLARRRSVTPGRSYNGEVEIISGLQPGELVIVSGTGRLTDGSRVRVVE